MGTGALCPGVCTRCSRHVRNDCRSSKICVAKLGGVSSCLADLVRARSHLLRSGLRDRPTSYDRLRETCQYQSAHSATSSEQSLSRIRPLAKRTHPTILSHTVLTYFFCSTPSLTIPTTVTISLVTSPTYPLSALTNSASRHGLLSICENGASSVSSSSRSMANSAAEMVAVKMSFSTSSETRSLNSGAMRSWRRSSSWSIDTGSQRLYGHAQRPKSPVKQSLSNTRRY